MSGGVLASAPAVVWPRNGVKPVDIAAVIDDHGRPGVWSKFLSLDGSDRPPCNDNAPGTCAQCGCNVPGAPACFQSQRAPTTP
jgi:hypothetical protein